MKHRQFSLGIQNPKNRRQTLSGLIISTRGSAGVGMENDDQPIVACLQMIRPNDSAAPRSCRNVEAVSDEGDGNRPYTTVTTK